MYLLCFNPRTPCGVRPALANLDMIDMWFQSTHSLRSATAVDVHSPDYYEVSIHALLAECDGIVNVNVNVPCGFNPRTPCGVRRGIGNRPARFALFQSTHSLRSATLGGHRKWSPRTVSIHALLAECDAAGSPAPSLRSSFNPRTPCGVRPPLTTWT